MKKRVVKGTNGWAWAFGGLLCKWVMPDRRSLEKEGKPTPEAVAVRVRILPMSEYRRLLKAAKQ